MGQTLPPRDGFKSQLCTDSLCVLGPVSGPLTVQWGEQNTELIGDFED